MNPRLAVIIPTLNEAERLPLLLDDLARQQGIALECWVSDGGSEDATLAKARAAGVEICVGRPGRGAQMNRAAARARAPWLLFLHADSRLTARDQLRRAVDTLRQHDPRQVAGHWPLRFADAPASHRRLFRFMEAKTASGRPGSIHGDQGLLLHRDAFQRFGGFRETLPYFEDVHFSEAVFARGRWVLLPGRLQTSARRFLSEGAGPRYTLMGLMMLMHAVGDEGFLHRAPGLYRPQHRTGRRSALPALGLAARRLAARPDRWPRLAAYTWAQRWQLRLLLSSAR
jgi:rSAM/selenodomain-associated transferase 2